MKIAKLRMFLPMVCLTIGMHPIASAQESESWEGAIELPETDDLKIEVTFNISAEPITGTIKIPEQTPLSMPLKNIEIVDQTVYFELEAGPGLAVFDGERLSDELIEGTFTQGATTGLFFLEPNEVDESITRVPSNSSEEAVQLVTETGIIHGTLLLPEGEKPPVALIIAGSGASDRDGNASPGPGMPTLELNVLKLLAIGLANEGIASVRFDKRGIGESHYEGFNEADLRFETYLSDVVGWVTQLQASDRFSNIVLIGHSEGALLAKLAALEVSVSGVVSLAGAGIPADELILEQIEKQLDEYPEAATVMEQLKATLISLKAGEELTNVPPILQGLFRESVRDYMRSWFKYDPREVASKLDVPLLVVQGSTDLQVMEENGRKLADANLDANLVEIDQMNHVLKEAGEAILQQMMVMSDPNAPLHKELVPVVVLFINNLGE